MSVCLCVHAHSFLVHTLIEAGGRPNMLLLRCHLSCFGRHGQARQTGRSSVPGTILLLPHQHWV